MKMTLTFNEKQKLLAQHSTTRDGRVRDRIKSVIHASNGWSPEEIADALLLHESTVRQHLNDYNDSKKLKPENGGSQSYLSATNTEELIAHLSEKTYFHTHHICAYIKEKYNVTYSVAGLNKWLHRNGFSYKQPKGVPHKFDSEKQQEFIDFYETLKAEVEEDELFFMDATHPTQATKLSYGWIRKGQDKTIKTTGSRSRLNLIGAMNLNQIDKAYVKRFDKVNGESIEDFFEQIRAYVNHNRPLHRVIDGAAYHRARAVKDKAKQLNITLHYLPPYSPNLNPIERLWKVMNQHARNNRYFASTKDFRAAIDNFFEVTLPKIGGDLSSWINDNFQVLNQAS